MKINEQIKLIDVNKKKRAAFLKDLEKNKQERFDCLEAVERMLVIKTMYKEQLARLQNAWLD